ncbi:MULTISPECIES: vWA domain-containing protein [Shewanella]|uniref:vWA domain-containing protein n=1 Tax=Shewanella TaxID=22 RepID=UPI000491A440|nr:MULTISPECIES: VWA domain-containing protein [Shewanella]QLE85044.1 VWA domain-containing protein [Shewanella sp. Scap07]
MFSIAWPWLFILLPLPLIFRRAQQQQKVTGHLQLPGVNQTAIEQVKQQSSRPSLLLWLIWICLVSAVTRPLWVGEPIELPSKGRDLMMAVDLSGSMQIQDMVIDGKPVDRLVLIKHVLSDFIERRQGDRLGLILFADHAYLQAPLTQDRRSVAQFLREAEIGLVGKQTAIGEAIALGVKRFEQVDESNRILILLTDGSNNSGSVTPQQAAEIAAKRGVTIYSVGVGAEVMERRSIFGTERVNPSMDLDEAELTKLAEMTGGRYFRARNSEELEQIYQAIDQLEPISREQFSYRPQADLFYYPLALALLFSMISVVINLPVMQQITRRKKGAL